MFLHIRTKYNSMINHILKSNSKYGYISKFFLPQQQNTHDTVLTKYKNKKIIDEYPNLRLYWP